MSIDDQIDAIFGIELDRHVVARQIVSEKKKSGKVGVHEADLAACITGFHITDTINGSSTLTINVLDEDWTLLDTGYFDSDEDGKLDDIEITYPDESDLRWRLTQVGLEMQGRGANLTLTFMERVAAVLLRHHGPVKVSRGKKTRAEFLKMLVDRSKVGADFHSKELHEKQTPKDSKEQRRQNKEERRKRKDGGLNPNEKLTIKGARATKDQLRLIEVALDEVTPFDPPKLAVLAMLCAGIGESSWTNVTNSAGYGGVLQGQVAIPGGSNWFGPMGDEERTAAQARCFMKGGKGYQGGGAIYQANHYPDKLPGEISITIEGAWTNFPSREAAINFYQRHIKEAEKLLEAYGGGGFGGFGGTTYRKRYNFQVGTPTNRHENFWDAMNRLADEVNWALFIDGDDVYYDTEPTLIRQKPIAIWSREDESVVDFSITWDVRRIATQATIDVLCDPFEFRAGEVVKLEEFGPASTGSTAKLPGRWLIETIERDRFALSSTFTLKQPEHPEPEPRAELVTRQGDNPATDVAGKIGGTPKHIIDKIVIPIGKESGLSVTATGPGSHSPTTGSGNTSDHAGPPSIRWAADMSNTSANSGGPSDETPEMMKCARALNDFFRMGWDPQSNPSAIKTYWPKGADTGYQFQLIHHINLGADGNHFNHVHFGCHIIYAKTQLGPQGLPTQSGLTH